ncbi:MAG: ABC transporter ATP-binding protein [Candidatus Nanoarchaeia archaeon]|nr:ABC transporter ATP-binding protein [Candidatus Nanoarchaeia archaeon]MDD5741460.1 ABC transporter ATP-binding protein [Candidatus Nanoarchaeia archaeon]
MDKKIIMDKSKEHKKKDIIRLEEVHKDYTMGNTKIHAVNGVSLDIHRGDFVAIIGPSGSGKSTMMNLVGALDFATTGDIYLDNVDIEHLYESDLAQLRGRKIGFIFQTFNLIPTLTALENVMLPMIFQNINKEERTEKATKILTRLKMGPRLNHLPSELSGGERQRVAIARALANDPEVILADEPTGNLDSKTGEGVIQIFEELNEEGKTIIMVTHDPNMAKHADKVYRLRDGMIVK